MRKIPGFLLILSCLFSPSCTKMLDTPNDGRIEMKDIFMSLARTRDYVNSCYDYLPAVGGFYPGGTLLAAYSDEAEDAKNHGNSAIQAWYEGRMSPSNNLLANSQNSYERFWQGIYRCNTFLQNIQDTVNMKTLFLSEQEKGGMIAQVRTLRAFYYLELIRRYGGVPILSGRYTVDQDLSKEERASFAKCVDYIIADCDAALSSPEPTAGAVGGFRWRPASDAEVTTVTRAMACAIKSRAALYAASPLWAADHNGAATAYTWDKAVQITKEALDLCLANGYELYTVKDGNAENAYGSYFLTMMQSSGLDKESIYQSRARASVWSMQGLPIIKGQSTAGAGPTQELVDAYELFDEGTATSVPLLKLEEPYIGGDHTKPNFNPAALAAPFNYSETSSAAMYTKRDPRLLTSVYYDSTFLNRATVVTTVDTRIGGNCEISSVNTNQRNTRTGYYIRKGNNYRSDQDNDQDGFIRIFRLAELYMNFAEAAYNSSYGVNGVVNLTNPVTGVPASNAANTALEAVNRVRERVGIAALPGNISTAAFELRYRNERRIEFAFEEFRFFDVRRWQAPGGNLAASDKVVSGMRIAANGASFTRFVFTERNTFEQKYLRLPLDFAEISRVRELTGTDWQNPGW
ncbi:RagB/SusD family nutrient uptake outer membrane protein [Chitinophaga sp. MM2321]|uniref:RagB/SusD family nutrient uptake outer membrane protein n=1 Tax=Chitinophaga sp. MM2321 TaxID=3137178 RepID=UPI0032D57FF5